MSNPIILSHSEIALKLDRIAWQILEHHYAEKSIVLVGIAESGSDVASKIKTRLEKFGSAKIYSTTISLNKEDALGSDAVLRKEVKLNGHPVIIVDDVLNSGVTMAAALKEVLNHSPKSVRTAVLANRDHHKFPIQANYVGISMATTLQEHITYEEVNGTMSIWLS